MEMRTGYPYWYNTYPTIYDDIIGEKKVIDGKEFPYQVNTKDFKTLKEAEAFAKKKASEEHEDVVIKQRISVVRFPIPDLKIESLF